MKKLIAAVALAGLSVASPALAQVYNFSITTSQDTASGQFTLGNPEQPNLVTGVTGMVDGAAITGLSGYGASDNRLSSTSPYVDRAGLAFSTENASFNIFDNYTDPSGNPVYSFCNSLFNGGCTGGDANAAPVATFTITPAAAGVPESATWAMMILGFGMAGAGLRYRRRQAQVSFA